VAEEGAEEEEGRRSSRPAPSLRRRPWRAVLAEVKDWGKGTSASSSGTGGEGWSEEEAPVRTSSKLVVNCTPDGRSLPRTSAPRCWLPPAGCPASAPFTRAWLNFFTLTFRALGRNHVVSKSP